MKNLYLISYWRKLMNSYIKLLKKGLFALILLNLVQIAQASQRDFISFDSSYRPVNDARSLYSRARSPMPSRGMQLLPVHQDFASSNSATSSDAEATNDRADTSSSTMLRSASSSSSISSISSSIATARPSLSVFSAAAAAAAATAAAHSAQSSTVSADAFTPSLATAQDREKSDSESDTDTSDSDQSEDLLFQSSPNQQKFDPSLFSKKFLKQLQSLNPQQAKLLMDQAALLTQQFKNYSRRSSSAAPVPAPAQLVSSLAKSAAAKSSSSQSASSSSTPAPTPAPLALPFNRQSVTGAPKHVHFANQDKLDKAKPDNAPKNSLDPKHKQPKNNSASTATAQSAQHGEIARLLASIASAVKFAAPKKRDAAQRHLLEIADCDEQTFNSRFKTTPDDEKRTKAVIDFVQKKLAQLDPSVLQEKHTRINKLLQILRGQSTPTAAPAATASVGSATPSGQSSRPSQHASTSAKSKMETAARAASSSQAAAATQTKPWLTAAEIGKASQIAKIKAHLDLIAKNGAQHATSAQIKSALEAITAKACGFAQVGKIDDLCQIIFEALHTKSTQELNALAQPISAIAQQFKAPNATQKSRVRS